jgi:hypothetical protein
MKSEAAFAMKLFSPSIAHVTLDPWVAGAKLNVRAYTLVGNVSRLLL